MDGLPLQGQGSQDWLAAQKAGNQAAMDAAHAKAEAIRASAGYSGGSDGSGKVSVSKTSSDGGVPVTVITPTGSTTGTSYDGVTYMADGSRPSNGSIVVAPDGTAYQMNSELGHGIQTTPVTVVNPNGSVTVAGANNGVTTMLDGSRPQDGAVVIAPDGTAYRMDASLGHGVPIKDTNDFEIVRLTAPVSSAGDRLGEGIWSLKSDWAGQGILFTWLYGDGDDFNANSSAWGNYMMNNSLLKGKVQDIVFELASTLSNGSSIEVDITTAMEIENGEDIIGYQYLHGTNKDVGGF